MEDSWGYLIAAIELQPDMANVLHEGLMEAFVVDQEATLEGEAEQSRSLQKVGEQGWRAIFCLASSTETGQPSQRPSHRPWRFHHLAQRHRCPPLPDAGTAISHPLTPRTAALPPRLPVPRDERRLTPGEPQDQVCL